MTSLDAGIATLRSAAGRVSSVWDALGRWLKVDDLEDLKGHLVSIIIAVLAVLFLSQAVERAGDADLLKLAASLALMIVALALFLFLRVSSKE